MEKPEEHWTGKGEFGVLPDSVRKPPMQCRLFTNSSSDARRSPLVFSSSHGMPVRFPLAHLAKLPLDFCLTLLEVVNLPLELSNFPRRAI